MAKGGPRLHLRPNRTGKLLGGECYQDVSQGSFSALESVRFAGFEKAAILLSNHGDVSACL